MKKKTKLIVSIVLCSAVIGFEAFKVYSTYEENKDIDASLSMNQTEYKRSPFTADEMYNYILTSTFPEDYDSFCDVITDWYSYFDKDTPFMNKHGEYYTYDEYMYATKGTAYQKEQLKIILPSAEKNWFFPK